MRGPKLMIAAIVVAFVATMGYAIYASGGLALTNSAAAKNPPTVRMVERELTETDRAIG